MTNANKPNWENAPEWASWLAMDGDGQWCWFEYTPEQYTSSIANGWNNPIGKYEMVSDIEGWENTLEERPK